MLLAEYIAVPGRLRGVSASFQQGKVTAICGPNGAGKSSLLAVLAGLLEPATGKVALDGVELDRIAPSVRAQAIGYLPQSAEVAWDVSAQTLVALGRIPWRGAPAGEAGEAIEQAIATMDVTSLRHRPMSHLSGGERARVLMARVLAGRPRWILADEPLANLDLAHAAALIGRLREQAGQGVGVVLVLHDLAQAMNHADEVLVLADGALAASGPPEQALAEAVIERVWGVKARWLGEPGQRALLTA